MASYGRGILGEVQGKVGTVVGSTWKGKAIIRSTPVPSRKAPSPKQMAQREKFRTVVDFLRPMQDFIEAGFAKDTESMTGFNRAVAYNYAHALTGKYPLFNIEYDLAAVTRGPLPNVLGATAEVAAGSMIEFRWANNNEVGRATVNDQVMLLVYCPQLNQSIYSMAAALRKDEGGTLRAREFSGNQVHVWIGCMSFDGRIAADSKYLGSLVVT